MLKILQSAPLWVMFAFILWSCEETPLQSGLSSDHLLTVDTLSVNGISGFTYHVPPEFGSHTKLYLGTIDSFECSYVLFQFAQSATNFSALTWSKLLESDSIIVDSVFFQVAVQTDSSGPRPDVECVNFSSVSDSIFNESKTTYENFGLGEYQTGTLIGNGNYVLIPPDSGETFLRWDFLSSAQSFVDSMSSRSVGLNLTSGSSDSLILFSRESIHPPQILVYYRTLDVDGNVVDTLNQSFAVLKDVTIATPPPITSKDQNQLSLSAGKGLKFILNLDLTPLDTLKGQLIFDKADLILPISDSLYNTELEIQVAPLADTLTTFGYVEKTEDDISVQSLYTMRASVANGNIELDLKYYLQAIQQTTITNLGLKFSVKSTSSPFETVHVDLINNPNASLKVLYVQAR